MKKTVPIKSRKTLRPTPYYPGRKMIQIPGIGKVPTFLRRIYHEELEAKFELAAATTDFIYYMDEEESDETSSVLMLDKNLRLISNNVFATNDLINKVERNGNLLNLSKKLGGTNKFLYLSKAVKYWQKEEFVKPKLITRKIKKLLNQVDIEGLTDNERTIYFAYLENGPAKYTKSEALMAVLSNDLDQAEFSPQLAAINEMIEVKEHSTSF